MRINRSLVYQALQIKTADALPPNFEVEIWVTVIGALIEEVID
jgi:hypothetical protein